VPGGVSTSIALGTVPGSTVHLGSLLGEAHTPNWNFLRSWLEASGLVGAEALSWPVSTTVNAQPGPGVPKARRRDVEGDVARDRVAADAQLRQRGAAGVDVALPESLDLDQAAQRARRGDGSCALGTTPPSWSSSTAAARATASSMLATR
jgi:hypothetical protein